jgi:hypothetical protein
MDIDYCEDSLTYNSSSTRPLTLFLATILPANYKLQYCLLDCHHLEHSVTVAFAITLTDAQIYGIIALYLLHSDATNSVNRLIFYFPSPPIHY